MTEYRNTQQRISQFRLRVRAAELFVFVCFALIVARFFVLQVWHHNQYSLQAEENRISEVPIVSNRGIITDRNGVVLAKNYSAYTLEITPAKLNDSLDNVINELSTIVPIDARDRSRFKRLQEDTKDFGSLPIRLRLTDDEVARFTAQQFRFPGVAVRARLFREYPLGETAAHVIGYIGHISQRDEDHIEQMSDANDNDTEHYDPRRDADNYIGTNYIGKTGVEESYETELHGLTGFEIIEITAGGHPVRTLSRTLSTPGNNLVLSIDIGLQQVAEKAFAGKRGALVAIEPATGDILAFVSAPSFDPNLFVEGIDQQTWDELNNSPSHPLLDRPLHGTYPPGSTYKPFMALAALTLHKRTPEWGMFDPGYYNFGGHTFHNDVRTGQGWVDMVRALTISNDTYFFRLAHDLGVDAIANFMKPWGFGQITGVDLSGEARGVLPSTEWKRDAYHEPEQQRWYEGETISLGIGQGYNSFTILQLAHATATLANNGVVMRPHVVKAVENPVTHAQRLIQENEGRINVRQADIDVVKKGMQGATSSPSGTAYSVFGGHTPYTVAGKTGTAQVYSLDGAKYRSSVARHLRDHALFIAFAPIDHPKIAVALVVENGGWGAQAAGPIARRVLDYYLVEQPKERSRAAAAGAASAAGGANGASGASETGGASAPVVVTSKPLKPVTIAAGFRALPLPGVAGATDAASAAEAASAVSSAPVPGASGARQAATRAAPVAATSGAGASHAPPRHSHHPASEATVMMDAPPRNRHRNHDTRHAADDDAQAHHPDRGGDNDGHRDGRGDGQEE